MARTRSVAAALVVPLLALGGVATTGAAASAAPDPLIQGVVVDGKGRPVLDARSSR